MAAILLVAAAVRVPTLTAGLPYLNYVDEGHVLRRVVHLLATGDWDPGWYIYGALPNYAIAGAALLYSPVYAAVHGRPLRQGLSPERPYVYNIVEPPELLVLGRSLSLLLSLASVALVGLLARRLAGAPAGLFAAWMAALLPALVIRGATINVDVWAVFFILAALVFCERLREPAATIGATGVTTATGSEAATSEGALGAAGTAGRGARDAILAGAMSGFAFVSKYPAGLICVAVAFAIAASPRRWQEKARLAALAATAAAAAVFAGMPALVIRTAKVARMLRLEARLYAEGASPSYWSQAVHRAEWDQPLASPELGYVFLVLVAAGLIVALLDRRWRKAALGWLLFSAVLGTVLASFPFHPLRNLLSFIALGCVTAALLYTRVREAAARSGRRWPVRAVDLAAAALPVVLFAVPLSQYVRHQLALEDSRHQAIVWLAAHTGPGDNVLISWELAILRCEIERLKAETLVEWWPRWRALARKDAFRYAVLGDLTLAGTRPIPPKAWDEILGHYQIKATFGERPVAEDAGTFHTNREKVYILESRGLAQQASEASPRAVDPDS
jgi:hypothetical protein